MSKEKINQIIDEVYERYSITAGMSTQVLSLTKDMFIHYIKTDVKFSEIWGLKIEERELSLDERRILWNKKVEPSENACEYVDGLSVVDAYDIFNQDNVSTKLITLTYNNEIIESYD